MFDLSEKFIRTCLLTVNSLFIASGISMMMYGIYQNLSAPSKAIDPDMLDNESNGTTSIVAGCMAILIGTCGVVGAILNKRFLLIANISLLGMAIIGNIIVLIVVSIAASKISNIATTNIKVAITTQYGNNTDQESKDFTVAIDEHQSIDRCCGWSGVDGENLFLKSPWFREANLMWKGKQRTLPESCCITRGDDCWSTENVKEARKYGFVKAEDCIDNIIDRAKFFLWTTILQVVFVIIMQSLIETLSVLSLLQSPPA